MKSWDVKRKSFDLSPKYEFIPSSPSTSSSPTAVISNWTPSKPNVTLYPSSSGPPSTPIAVAHFHKLSSSIRIGIGDPSSSPSAVQWTELTKKGLRGKEYRLTYQPAPEAPPRIFVWRKVSMWAGKDFELLDEGAGALIARFEGKRGWSGKVGRLEVGVEMDEEMEAMVIITILGIQERIRRARSGSAAAGGAAAG